MKKFFFLIGSSGSGKTTVAKSIEAMNLPDFVMHYSDSEPAPSVEEMIKEYGSTDEWQKACTNRWVKRIRNEYLTDKDVLFDTQSRPSFIDEACESNGILNYEIILLDCSDEERKKRLISRNQPELANQQMMDWAKYLRERCVGKNHIIVDNTDFTPKQTLRKMLDILGR